jgi:hypothetical protein
MKGIVDRFEGDFVVIEIEGNTKDILKKQVDSSVKVNDVVELVDGKWMVKEADTERRRKEIKALMDSVWED